jgi:DNA-binding MarR family transcriptional regulator
MGVSFVSVDGSGVPFSGTDAARAIVATLPVVAGVLSGMRASTLAILALVSDRRVLCISEIRDLLGISQATASEWVKAAEAAGFVERQREAQGMPPVHRRKVARNDNLDGRKRLVVLSAKGKQLMRRARGLSEGQHERERDGIAIPGPDTQRARARRGSGADADATVGGGRAGRDR